MDRIPIHRRVVEHRQIQWRDHVGGQDQSLGRTDRYPDKRGRLDQSRDDLLVFGDGTHRLIIARLASAYRTQGFR